MKQINKLALASYKNGELDNYLVSKITKKLKRRDLKNYIKALKLIEEKKTIIVNVADDNISNEIRVYIKSLFKNKKIKIKQDKSLIAGLSIKDYDTVYEFDLKSKLEQITKFIEE